MPGSSSTQQATALFGRGHSGYQRRDVEPCCAASTYDDVPFEVATRTSVDAGYKFLDEEASVANSEASSGPGTLMMHSANQDHMKQSSKKSQNQFGAPFVQQPVSSGLMTSVPFPSWVEQMLRQVLAARTRFSYFVLCSIQASRNGRDDSIATALFPIPCPFVDLFGVGLSQFGKKKRRSFAMRKLLHLAVMALNFEHFRNPMSVLPLVRRHPSEAHRAVYARLWMFLKACGPPDSVSVSGCGRKSFQLSARFDELVDALNRLGLNPTSMYHGGASGFEVPEDNDVRDELRPYRPLDAGRIRVSGTGNWACEEFLSDLLYLPFMEPRVNAFDIVPPPDAYPDVKDNDADEVFELCKVWDAKGLLCLIPGDLGPAPHELHLHTRVFGNYKNKDADRQIGDRRGRNFTEGRLFPGPSSEIPNATSLLQIEVQRYKQVLVGAAADRKDFYHQFAVSYERASTNTMFPAFALGRFKGMRAYEQFALDFARKQKAKREEKGDFLGVPKPLLIDKHDDGRVYAAFSALYQGDHLGVEFACSAHGGLLEESGCHPSWNRLRNGQAIVHNSPVSGLVIDDYFVVSSEPVDGACGELYVNGNASQTFLDTAKAAYAEHRITGSDDKEVRNALKFKIIGAEVNSSEGLAKAGVVSLGAPADKRFGLSMLSATAACIPYTTDSLHSSLVGSWISTLLYRRPMMAHMNALFQVIASHELDTESPKMHPLPRKAAEELLILACLAPFAASNVAVPFSDRLYATDSSTGKGGVVMTSVCPDVSRALWRTANRKAKNPKLESRTSALARLHNFWHEDEDFAEGAEDEDFAGDVVHRPIGLRFEFLEVCGGAGVVTKHLASLGVVCGRCGPILDISYSRRFDITDRRVFTWICFMLEEGRLLSLLAAPPCTTFSAAAYPALRTYKKPLGIDPKHPRVVHGNDMAFSCLGCLMVAKRTRSPGMMETPRRSKLRWTRHWKRMRRLGADEVLLASCEYGSPHQKEFALMTVGMNAQCLARKCSRTHRHVPIQGRFTKPSATYCDGLAIALAKVFEYHIRHRYEFAESHELRTAGLEDILSNDVLQSYDWQVLHSWKWRGSAHINILETASVLRSFEAEAMRGGDLRFVSFIDSNVALCALARGRSSSDALKLLLKRASTTAVAFGLYHAGRFAPTRLNPGDHPTRDSDIPPPTSSLYSGSDAVHLRWIASLAGIRRWSANWIRLSILLCPSWIGFFSHPSSYRRLGQLLGIDPPLLMDFDSTLGFPGEGPMNCQLVSWICLLIIFGVAGAVGVRNGDALRRDLRKGLELPEGRRVTEATNSVRAQLVSTFNSWLRDVGLSYDSVFQANPPDLDQVNAVLTRYGRHLFAEGKPYYHFAETINAVSARRPILRRSLQQAWDLCAMWTSFEPVEHHQAMPYQVLLAVLSTCLVWGWVKEAAIFAMCWGMLLRVGELINARRADIVFPQDVQNSIDYVLLKILEPKTRFRAARHQSSKLEPPDLIMVAWIGLGKMRPDERIWSCSPSTLRSGLDRVLSRLGLPTKTVNSRRPLTLASFRPGGATYMIGLTESSEMVRRRGRWLSLRVMEVYLQEVAASTFLTDLDEKTRQTILLAMEQFPQVLTTSVKFFESRFPEKAWNLLFRQMPLGVFKTGQLGEMGAKVPQQMAPPATDK